MEHEVDVVALRGRVAALEFAMMTQIMLEGSQEPNFNPIEFAAQRAAFWKNAGEAMNTDNHPASDAFAAALEKLGNLLVTLAQPIDQEVRRRNSTV